MSNNTNPPAKQQLGVSLDFLLSLRDDPRVQSSMISLAYPNIDPTILSAKRLSEIARKLRVFSHLSRNEENAMYKNDDITRKQWEAYLRQPPVTTSQILSCVVIPDTQRIDGSGSYVNKLLKGTSQSGNATDFVCHAHSYRFDHLVTALEIEAKEQTNAEFTIYQEEIDRRRVERERRSAAALAKRREKPSPRKQVIRRQTKSLKRHGYSMRHASHQTTARFSAGFGKQKKRINVPKPLVFGGKNKNKNNQRPSTAGPRRSAIKKKGTRPQTAQRQQQRVGFSSPSQQRPSTAPLATKGSGRRNTLQPVRRGNGVPKTHKQDPFFVSWNNKPLTGTTDFLPQTASPERLAPPIHYNNVNLDSLWHAIHVPNISSTSLPFDPKEAFDDDLHEQHPLTLIKQGFKINHSDLDRVPRGRFNIMLRWANAASWSKSPFAAFDAERKRQSRAAEKNRQEKNEKEESRRKRRELSKSHGGSPAQKKFDKIIDTLMGATGPVDMRKKREGAVKKLKALGTGSKKQRKSGHFLYGGDSKDDEDGNKEYQDPLFVPSQRFYWIDIFVQDPHFVDGSDGDESKVLEFYSTHLRDIITSIGRTVLVLEPLLAPVPFRRSRCLWALYLTSIHNEIVELRIAFPKEEHLRFQRKLVKKFNKLVDIFCSLKSERSSQYYTPARRGLRHILQQEGHDRVNDVCRGALTVFLLRKARAALNRLVDDEAVPLPTEAILLCNQFGHLLMNGNEYRPEEWLEAEKLLQRGLTDAENVNGSVVRPKDVVTIRGHLATLLKMRGKWHEALAKMERNLEASKRTFGDGSSEALNCANTYASLLTRVGQSGKAETLYRSALTSSERAQHEGYGQGDNMIYMFADEGCRTMMNEKGASTLDTRVRNASNPLIGKVGESMQRDTQNLSLLMEADAHLGLGDFEKPIRLYRRVLAGNRKTMGIHHPSTFLALFNLAHALYQKSEHIGDKSILAEAENCARLSLEGYTQFNLVSDIRDGVQLLGNILLSLDREEEATELADRAGLIFFCGRLLQKEK